MVQVLPAKYNVGDQVGGRLEQGLIKGGEIGVQRGMLQNALKGIGNVQPGTTPVDLAKQLFSATAGIPGGEQLASQLYPLLLAQMQSQAAFGQNGQTPTPTNAAGGGTQTEAGGATPGGQQSGQGASPGNPTGGTPGGLLGQLIPQDQIASQAQNYAIQTGTGIEGAQKQAQFLEQQNARVTKQRDAIKAQAVEAGVPPDKLNLWMQIAEKHKFAKTNEDLVRATNRDFKEYNNLSASLDTANYPGLLYGAIREPGARGKRLKELQGTVKRLVDKGFEQEVRQKLESQDLSPTEIGELIHPFSSEQEKSLNNLPSTKFGGDSDRKRLTSAIDKNLTPKTSILALRQKLVDKGYNWKEVAAKVREIGGDKLTIAQENELGIAEREPPRQSLTYIFRDWGNIFRNIKGQK